MTSQGANQFGLFKNAEGAEVFPAGAVVFDEGDAAEHLYVVQSGTVEITKDGRVLETLGPGAMFGEMALVDSAPRTASARTTERSALVPVDLPRFRRLVHDTPFFAETVLRVMAERLRRKDSSDAEA